MRRRAPLYALTFLIAAAVQTAVTILSHSNSLAVIFVSWITLPMANVIVLVNAGADAGGWTAGSGGRWERIVERAWAVILLDVAISFIQTSGLAAAISGDIGVRIEGLSVLLMSTMLVYAEPYAALEQNVSQLTVVPFAIVRSMMLAWVNVPRILAFFSVELAYAAGYVLLGTIQTHPGVMTLAVQLAYNTAASMVLAALFAAAYLDTAAQEKESAL